VDGKNRVTVPAKWRGEALEELFAMADPALGIIKLLPREERDRIGQKAARDFQDDPAKAKWFRRVWFGNAVECPLDREGRVVLPADMTARLGLGKEVTLVGVGEAIEVWDPPKWDGLTDSAEGDFTAMAEKLGV
jgi:MraZ protein